MRQIKFRAWDKKTSTIREVSELKFDGAHYNARLIFPTEFAPRNWDLRMFDKVELMQFTGLKDRNGVDIYEGDILQDTLTKIIYEVKFGKCVKYAYNGWFVENKEQNYVTTINGDYDTDSNSQIEVIGNIYEHPNLLTNE